MKKIILTICMLLFCSIIYAQTFPVSLPSAIEWWLRGQGKIDVASVTTLQISGTDTCEITKWKVPGVPKPTEQQMNQIIANYTAQYVPEETIEERIKKLEKKTKDLP